MPVLTNKVTNGPHQGVHRSRRTVLRLLLNLSGAAEALDRFARAPRLPYGPFGGREHNCVAFSPCLMLRGRWFIVVGLYRWTFYPRNCPYKKGLHRKCGMMAAEGVMNRSLPLPHSLFYHGVITVVLATVYYDVTGQGAEDRPRVNWVLRVSTNRTSAAGFHTMLVLLS